MSNYIDNQQNTEDHLATNYIVGHNYKYSNIPENSTDDLTVNNYGAEYLGQNAIHLRYHKIETDVWFIWYGQTNEGIFNCVYNH